MYILQNNIYYSNHEVKFKYTKLYTYPWIAYMYSKYKTTDWKSKYLIWFMVGGKQVLRIGVQSTI